MIPVETYEIICLVNYVAKKRNAMINLRDESISYFLFEIDIDFNIETFRKMLT